MHPHPSGHDSLLTCAHCGAILRLDSRAFAPVEHADGLICPGCDETELADAAERASEQSQRHPAVQHQLDRAARKAAPRRFTGEPITGFGALP